MAQASEHTSQYMLCMLQYNLSTPALLYAALLVIETRVMVDIHHRNS